MNRLSSPYLFYSILILYLLLGLINLAYIPIPWLDEAACLEPAVQWHKTGQYISKAWPTAGTEQIFLSYPPVIVFLHILNLYIVPLEVFWVRLPFLLLHVGSLFLFYSLLRKKMNMPALLSLLIGCLFMFDKAVFEISRSVRSEVIEMFLIALYLTLFYGKRPAFLCGLLLGAMLLTHLKLWPLVAVFGIWGLWFGFSAEKKWSFLAGIVALPLLFLIFIDFQLVELYRQMFTHSAVHAAQGNVFQKIADFFVGRFFPVYKEHVWVPFLHALMFFAAVKTAIERKGKDMLSIAFLFSSLVWIFALGPYYRYWPPLFLIGLIILVQWLSKINWNFSVMYKWYFVPFWMVLLFPFLSRHFLGFVQRPERDPKAMEAFVNQYIPAREKSLFFGADIGIYVSGKKQNLDFTHVTSPDHFEFEDYKYIYYVTDLELPLKRLATYRPDSFRMPSWVYKLGKGGTFANTHVYLVQTDLEWESVAIDFYKK